MERERIRLAKKSFTSTHARKPSLSNLIEQTSYFPQLHIRGYVFSSLPSSTTLIISFFLLPHHLIYTSLHTAKHYNARIYQHEPKKSYSSFIQHHPQLSRSVPYCSKVSNNSSNALQVDEKTTRRKKTKSLVRWNEASSNSNQKPRRKKDAVLKTCEYALYRRCIEGTNAVDIQKTRRLCEKCKKNSCRRSCREGIGYR